jgi:hypothetical protein
MRECLKCNVHGLSISCVKWPSILNKFLLFGTCPQIRGHFQCPKREEIRVEVPITNHLRESMSNMEKYKAMQNFHVQEDRNKEEYIFIFISLN